MSQLIQLDESNASRRIIYLWSVLSNGTSPAQFEAGGQPTMSVAGLPVWNSAGTLLSVNTTVGEYQIRLGTSDVSVLGPGVIRYSSSSALETSIPFQIVAFNPYGSLSTFDPSTTSVGLKAQTHSGATVAGLVSDVSIRGGSYSSVTIAGVTRVNSNVTIADANYSGVTVRVGGIAPGTYSGVTVGINNIAPNAYSGVTVETQGGSFSLAPGVYSDVTVQINGIAPNSYSGVTIAGVTRVNSNVTMADADYSGVTVRVGGGTVGTVTNPVTVGTNNDKTGYGLAAGTYSGVTVGVNNIAPGSYSGVTIAGVTRVNSNVTIADADYSGVTVRASNLTIATGGIVAASFGAGAIDAVAVATDAGQEFADRVLLRNIASGSDGGRSVAEALYALRNRVAIDGSIGTVYQVNDTSSAWTFSVQTVSTNSGLVNSVDPG